MVGGGFQGVEDVYRSLLDNGAMEQVKEITLLGVWRYEKKAVLREVIDQEMRVKMFSMSNLTQYNIIGFSLGG